MHIITQNVKTAVPRIKRLVMKLNLTWAYALLHKYVYDLFKDTLTQFLAKTALPKFLKGSGGTAYTAVESNLAVCFPTKESNEVIWKRILRWGKLTGFMKQGHSGTYL